MTLVIFLLQLFSLNSGIEKSLFSKGHNDPIFELSKSKDSLPKNIKKIKLLYKDVSDFKDNQLIFSNKLRLIYDDRKIRSTSELLDNPDVEDMFHWHYDTSRVIPNYKEDAGRIRNESFFKALYGGSQEEVRKNLKSFVWCPKLVNQTILFNQKHGALDALRRVSNELDLHPEWKKYITNIGGTFNWRKISGTNRLSAHSFGITFDINTSFSNYWQWDCGCKKEDVKLSYKNKIPMELVKIFEKNGFIWGGRWYHYDTMHFEYRPEMFD